MSVISSNHTFVPFVAGQSKAFEGQVLAKATYKGRNGKAPEFASVCVSIPKMDLNTEQILAAKDHILAMFEDCREKIIRGLHEAGKTSVNDAEIGFAACLEYLEDVKQGTRLSGEDVKQWFEESFADSLRVVFADKLGLGDNPNDAEVKQVEQRVNGYREACVSLASPRTLFKDAKAIALKDAITKHCNDSDPMAMRFVARLDKMLIENAKMSQDLEAL